jgi:Mg2+/Co2+ transporter CorC
VFGLAGKIPAEGEGVELSPYRFTVEKLQGRRIIAVLLEHIPEEQDAPTSDEEQSNHR